MFIFLIVGCRRPGNQEDVADSDILVTVGDSSLTMRDVISRIPNGLSEADSSALFSQIVDTWVRELVLTDFARKNIDDIDRIERLVETYRKNLIVTTYLQSMTEHGASDISEDRIRKFYQANRENMILEEPIIKGAFLKVSESDQSLDRLRAWMTDFSDQSVDKIEEAGLRHASTYKYFKDQWQPWSEIAQQIPYRFFDADAFVSSQKNFETSDAGSVYLLHISAFVPSGSEMPYDYAKFRIREILASDDRARRIDKLITDIYRQQIDAGVLHPGVYDPISRQLSLTRADR